MNTPNGPTLIDTRVHAEPMQLYSVPKNLNSSIRSREIELNINLPPLEQVEKLQISEDKNAHLTMDKDLKTPKQILEKYTFIQKCRTTWKKRFTSIKKGLVNKTILTLTTVQKAFNYTSNGLKVLTDPGVNLLKSFPKVTEKLGKVSAQTALPFGLYSGIVTIVTAPILFFFAKRTKDSVDKHIDQMKDKTPLFLSDKQFTSELKRRLKDQTVNLEETRQWFSEQTEGAQLTPLLRELGYTINGDERKQVLKAINSPTTANAILSKRDEKVSEQFITDINKHATIRYSSEKQRELTKKYMNSSDVSLHTLYEALSGTAYDKSEGELLKELTNSPHEEHVDALLEMCKRSFQGEEKQWEHILNDRIVMFEIRRKLVKNGIALDPTMTLKTFNKKFNSDKKFKKRIQFVTHSHRRSQANLQQMVKNRQIQEHKRFYHIFTQRNKEFTNETDDILNLKPTKDEYNSVREKLIKFYIPIETLPSPKDPSFENFIGMHTELSAVDEQLNAIIDDPKVSEDQKVTLLNHRAHLLKSLKNLQVGSYVSNLDDLKPYFSNADRITALRSIGTQNEARHVETLSALSRNGLKEVAKKKAVLERKFFDLTWLKCKVMTPVGITMAVISIASIALVALGVIASAPAWLGPLGWAVFGLGVAFAAASIIHEIRNKPRLLYENTVKLRSFRKSYRNIIYRYNKWKLDKQLRKLKYTQIVHRLIGLRLSGEDTVELTKKLKNLDIPNHLKEILTKDFSLETNQDKKLYLQEKLRKYHNQISKMSEKIDRENKKTSKTQKKLQKHMDKLRKAGMKDAIQGGYKIENLFKKKKENNLWKELAINFDEYVDDRSQLIPEILPKHDSTTDSNTGKFINISDALISIDQLGGIDQQLKDILHKRMGINVDTLKNDHKGEIYKFEEQIPKELEAFFASNISNISQIAKNLEATPKFSSIYY